MSTPPSGILTAPYYEHWLYDNPFRRSGYTCRVCGSDTGCHSECPAASIQEKLAEINSMMIEWRNR